MAGRGKALVLVAVAGLCALGSLAVAQDAPPAERGEGDPARLRGLLERRMEMLERQEERLREIMDRLDAGESPAEIFAELRERGELALLGEFGREFGRGGGPEGLRGLRGGPEGRPGVDGGQDGGEAPTAEDYTIWRNRIMAFFEEHAPEMAKRLREGGDSPEAQRAVLRLRREVARLIEMKEQGSEEFRPALERLRNGMRIADVLGRVRQAALSGTLDDATLRMLRRELSEIVAKQFDAELAAREEFLTRMGERLAGAREKLERERAERSQRIEREVQTMLDRATRGGEEPGPGGPRRGPR